MKKLLLVFSFVLFTFFYSNAQVIDLIGKGTLNESSSNLPLSDLYNIDHVDVGSVYKGPLLNPIPTNGVSFSDLNEDPTSIWNADFTDLNPNPALTKGYYSAAFSSFDVGGINASISLSNVHSYYAFIHRNILASTFKSYSSLETVFMYHNGADNAYDYIIPINEDIGSRNIKFKIPITELDESGRNVIIDIRAGSKTLHAVVSTYNLGNSFFIGEYVLENVPRNVASVRVSIYSPDPGEGEDNGDSFFVSGVIVDVDKVFDGCTLTQGYWKTHSTCKKNGNGPKRDDTWDEIPGGEAEETIFFLSGQDYCGVYASQPNNKNGKYYILAHQYIAAQLNLLSNADPTDVANAFNAATEFLSMYSPEDVKGDKALEKKCVDLGGILADFNEGAIGPGHCDDIDDEASIDPVKLIIDKVLIYPNPATTYGKIEFTSKQSANTTIELYNLSGQKVGVLFDKKTKKGESVNIEYNTDQFKGGLYFAIIKNGSDVIKEKISIIK
jgi:hypothetical protein